MSSRPFLNIPDLPTSISIVNQLSRVMRLSGVRDIPANGTVVVNLNNIHEARRLHIWRSITSAVNAGTLAFTTPNPLYGTVRVKNLTASTQSLGGLCKAFAPNEVRDVNLVNCSVSIRIRLWRAIKRANAGSILAYEATPASDNPTVSSISPATSDLAGGTTVTIKGEDFAPGATVTIGGVSCTAVTFVDDSTITCVTPTGTAGAKDVVVTNSGGHTGTLAASFTYTAVGFTSIAPTSGLAAGGTPFTITGTNFKPGMVVTIGGVAVTTPVVVSATSFTGVTGAHGTGAVNVVLTNPGSGGSTATGTAAFTYT